MAAFPAIIIILRHEEMPRPFCPAMNSFWYLICNYILGYCERPEQLAILISRLLLRMCGEYTYPALFWTFTKNGARLELRSLFHSLFATLRLRGRLARDGFSSALWHCFGGRIFNVAANLSPKTVPQCTFTTISTRSLAQPQRGESDRAHFELLLHETLAKLNVGAIAFESISLLAFV